MSRSFRSEIYLTLGDDDLRQFDIFAGENLIENDPVYVNSDGKIYRVTTSETAVANFIGLVAAAVSANQSARVHLPNQRVTTLSGLSRGTEYFLYNGALVPFSSIPAGAWCRQVGIADSSTSMVLYLGLVMQKANN